MLKQKTINLTREKAPKLWLHLRATHQKLGQKVMKAFLFGSWLMVALWVVVSMVLFTHNWPWACLMMFCTLAFASYLTVVAVQIALSQKRSFELTVDSDKFTLNMFDPQTGKRTENTLPWKDVEWVEVYRYIDEPAVVLRGGTSSLEIPVWAFGKRTAELMCLLRTQRVPILYVP